MSAGQVMGGMQALDELSLAAAVGQVPYRLRIPRGSSITMAIASAKLPAKLVIDPTLPMGKAVWHPPLRMRIQRIAVRGPFDDVERWAGSRGLIIGPGGADELAGAVLCIDGPERYAWLAGFQREGLALVTLPSWVGRPGWDGPAAGLWDELILGGAEVLEPSWVPPYPAEADPTPAAVVAAVEATLRYVAQWGQAAADTAVRAAEYASSLAEVRDAATCAVCEEVTCDRWCPLAPVRVAR